MRLKFIVLAAGLIALAADITSIFITPAYAEPDSCCCALPLYDTVPGIGRRIPPYADLLPQLSPDGKYLSTISGEFDSAFVVNLTTLKRTAILIKSGLPQIVQTIFSIAWCPYDADLMAINVNLTDTFDSGRSWYGNIYTYRVSTGESKQITPKILGPEGALGPLQLLSWCKGSTSLSDTLEISGIDDDSEKFYIPQTQEIFRTPWYGRLQTLTESRSGRHYVRGDINWNINYQIDGQPLPDSVESLNRASFSPNEKLLALSVEPVGTGPPADTVFPQVWIYHVDSLDAPPMVIDFQKLFCMYSFWGIDAEFITDSTLAVSMHKDGDISSPLWEITLDGRIVRKLTFLPELADVKSVAATSADFSARPSPAANQIIISIPSLKGEGSFAILDAAGRTVLLREIPAATRSFELSTASLPNGTYFCRLLNGENIRVAKIVVQH